MTIRLNLKEERGNFKRKINKVINESFKSVLNYINNIGIKVRILKEN